MDFSKIHFHDDDIHKATNIIILRIRNVKKDKINHSVMNLDRCCKSNGWFDTVNTLKFGGKDDIERISCNMTKKLFLSDYVRQRNHVILTNCTSDWKASNWTFKGI